MSGGFADPVVTALGTLIKQQIMSPNFITGISGWRIAKDGSAEFNNLTIRGTFFGTDYIVNSSGIFFYSGTPAHGNLILALAPVAGTDSFVNSYNAGFTAGATGSGEQIVIGVHSGSPLIFFLSAIATALNNAALMLNLTGSGTAIYDTLVIKSSQDTAHVDYVAINLDGNSNDGTHGTNLSLAYVDTGGGAHFQVLVNGSGVAINDLLSQAFTADTSALLLQSNTASSANAFIKQIHAAVGSLGLRMLVNGDSADRFNVNAAGNMHWGPGNAALDTFLQRAAAGILSTTQSILVGSTTALGDNGVGEVQLANATTNPTTNPVGGAVLHVKQGVPSVRDPGGNELGMVRTYSQDATANLNTFTVETDVTGATINVVVTGSNATIIVSAQFDFQVLTTAGTNMVGFLSWNGADRTQQAVFTASTVPDRKCISRTWRITSVTAGTYVAKLRATCGTSAVNNQVNFPHTGLVVTVIDQ